jgi:hypothetical protein
MDMKTFFLIIVIFTSLLTGTASAQKKPISLTGENYLMLNGERFKSQKIVFTKAEGDWFATETDGHGAIEFTCLSEGKPIRLNIEWDGRKEPHIVNDEIRHDGHRLGEFTITQEDKATYGDGLNATPSEKDEIRITILKVDDLTVSGEISGVITQGGKKVKLTGAFNLKKNETSKKITNSGYKDCDNVIHDKLIGAEGRSPSECEVKYDLDVRTAMHDALQGVIEKLKKEGWQVQDETNLAPIYVVGRGSEKDIFNTEYELTLQVSPASAIYASYQQKFSDYSDKLKSGSKEDMERFMNFGREMNSAIKMYINFQVNMHSCDFNNYRGGAKVTKLSANVYKIESPYVAARSGGGEDNAMDATFLLIGNWKQPVIQKTGDGGETMKSAAVLNPTAPHLKTQNIFIRMECNASLGEEIINNLDLLKLQSLLNN